MANGNPSVRSLLVLVTTIAAMLALFGLVPGDKPITPYLIMSIYIFAWLIPAGSFGYDANPTSAGFVKGALIGLVFCILSMMFFAYCLPSI